MGAFSKIALKKKLTDAQLMLALLPGSKLPATSSGPTYWTPANYTSSTITMGIDDYASGAPADGTTLSTLLDRWGTGVNGVVSDVLLPTYKTGTFGTGGSFLFTATTSPTYAIPGAPLQSTHTWIAVVKWTSVSGNDYSALGNYTNTAMNGPGNMDLANIHYRASGFASYPAQAGAGISFDGVDNGGHTLNAWHVIVLPFNMTAGQASTLRVDGNSYALGGTFTSFPANLSRILLMGALSSGRSIGYLRCQFLIPGLLTLDEMQRFEGYYANLGGFNLNLEASHPWRGSAPTV